MKHSNETMKHFSDLDLHRVAVASPNLHLGNPEANRREFAELWEKSEAKGACLTVFPELCLSGYSCGDLFFNAGLLDAVDAALAALVEFSLHRKSVAVLGVPFRIDAKLYNTAVLIGGGKLHGIVPKTHLPNAQEFYEARWFAAAGQLRAKEISWRGQQVPVGEDLLFEFEGFRDFVLGLEICQDLWVPLPPAASKALAGATIIANPAASTAVVGKRNARAMAVLQASQRYVGAYLYSACGPNESSSEVLFSGDCRMAQCGTLLAESEALSFNSQLLFADIDVQLIRHHRDTDRSFKADNSSTQTFRKLKIPCEVLGPELSAPLCKTPAKRPFLADTPELLKTHCKEAFAIQTHALARRIRAAGARKLVLGLSGGLDSAIALLVCMRAAELVGWKPEAVLAVGLPCFGSSTRTQSNAQAFAEALGASWKSIELQAAVLQHFKDIGHSEKDAKQPFENAQARERTQVLMDLANHLNGLMVGTSDLSELALGWCTYGGDSISMYQVNSGIPKTFLQQMAREFQADLPEAASSVLGDILATPISAELSPKHQAADTESIIGPYILHDFFLWHLLHHGCAPSKVLFLAEKAFEGVYNRAVLQKHLRTFCERFVAQQFKRSCAPDGPKVLAFSLNPRGDWRMPSDAQAAFWLDDKAAFGLDANQGVAGN